MHGIRTMMYFIICGNDEPLVQIDTLFQKPGNDVRALPGIDVIDSGRFLQIGMTNVGTANRTGAVIYDICLVMSSLAAPVFHLDAR